MIGTLEITGFRAARRVVLDELGDVNLFVGPNGTGKSTLLCAAFLFCLDGDALKLLTLVPPETEETDPAGIERALSWLFRRTSPDQSITDLLVRSPSAVLVQGKVDGELRSVEVSPLDSQSGLVKATQIDRRSQRNEPQSEPVNLSALKNSASFALQLKTTFKDEERIGRLYVSQSHGVFGESEKHRSRVPASLTRGRANAVDIAKLVDEAQSSGTKGQVEELLRNIDPCVRELLIGVAPNETPVVRVNHDRLGLCPLNVLGDGFTAALSFALRLSDSKMKHAIVDEFDSYLHVSVLRHLVKFSRDISKNGVQLFLTTHRADTVGEFVDLAADGWDGLRIFQTRLENGEIKVRSFKGDQLLTVWKELALDIRVPS